MSLETFIDKEANYLKYELKKYHKVIDYLLGFLNESQWQQAIEESLTNDDLSYSIMEDVFSDFVDDWSINTDVDKVILQACYNVKKYTPKEKFDTPVYETIITNLEKKRLKKR